MLNNQAQAAAQQVGLTPASYAAGANNGSWLDVRAIEGDILIDILIGAVTGSTIVKVQDATDGSGTGAADVTGAVTASLTTANSITKLTVPAGSVRGWIRVVATVTTGPVFHGVGVLGHPKYA